MQLKGVLNLTSKGIFLFSLQGVYKTIVVACLNNVTLTVSNTESAFVVMISSQMPFQALFCFKHCITQMEVVIVAKFLYSAPNMKWVV